MQTTFITLIIPTFRRPAYLRKCLRSVCCQDRLPDEVLVGIHESDLDSQPVLHEFNMVLNVRPVIHDGIGAVGSMNACLERATGELIALVDDDVELPAFWLSRMCLHLHNHPTAVGVAGRDLLQDHPEMRRSEPTTLDVGRLHCYGRITGNHHRAGGPARAVDILRGSNCLFRATFLKSVGFEGSLRGKGAQVHWELALALQAKIRHQHFFFDPSVEVIHNVAPRHDNDQIHRGKFDRDATRALAFNESFVILKHARGYFRITSLLWQIFVGSSSCPGLVHFVFHLFRKDQALGPRLFATMAGRREALKVVIREPSRRLRVSGPKLPRRGFEN